MATPNRPLIELLRTTASRLEAGSRYSWGHAGQCNCGHLAQAATGLSSGEIHRRMLSRAHERAMHRGEWSEHAEAYCGESGMDVEFIFEALMEVGLTSRDLSHLEYLNDPNVLARLPVDRRNMKRSNRADAVTYMRCWAEVLESELPQTQVRPAAALLKRRSEPVLV